MIEGELEVVSQQKNGDEDLATINTRLVSVIVNKGKYIISADDRTTVIVVLDGSVLVLDNSSKKKETVKAEHTAVIVPAPKFQGRGVDTSFKRGNMFTIKDTSNPDAESYLLGVNSIEKSAIQFRFIVVDKSVRGVKIN